MKRPNGSQLRHIIIRVGLAFVFISIGIWEIVQPGYWSFYIPKFLTVLSSANELTMFHGLALLALGLLVLVGAYLRITALLCALMMAAILGDLILSFGFTDIVIRDVAIFLMAVSLYFDDTDYLRLTE